MRLTRLRGFQDQLGAEARASSLVEERARAMAHRYNLDEIRIPMMERIDLYQRSTGETSDIVSKQMYVVRRSDDSGGTEEMILRPEGTPGVVRAYVEARLDRVAPYQRFFYSGPMLRYEKPQKGRYRQFHQFGVEIFGRADAACDAELMIMVNDVMRDLHLDVRFEVNSLGHDAENCRPRFREALLKYGREHLPELCEDCHQRLDRNPLRLLDCKKDAEKVAKYAPKSLDYICDECLVHFNSVQEFLSRSGVPYEIKPSLVRGLDYYTRTAFEVVSAAVGAQSALAAGGRYDGLVKELGGASVPGSGFAIGVERTAIASQAKEIRSEHGPGVVIVPLGQAAALAGMTYAHALRGHGLRVEMLPADQKIDRKLRTALTIAGHTAGVVVVVGENELARGVVQIRNPAASARYEIPQDTLVSHLADSKKNEPLQVFRRPSQEFSQRRGLTISVPTNEAPSSVHQFVISDPRPISGLFSSPWYESNFLSFLSNEQKNRRSKRSWESTLSLPIEMTRPSRPHDPSGHNK